MRLSVASSALAAAFVLMPVAFGSAPALGQDFSITNQEAPASAGRRDVMRQLQAWWDAHAYYPRHASNRNESGTVEVNLVILPDGRIATIDLVDSSGSRSLDTAGESVFRGASVRPFPPGEPEADIDVSLHYVLTHRHDQQPVAGYTPALSKSPFTITNDPVKSPVLDTMLQRVCTGTMVMGGIPNQPLFGTRSAAQAIFFRKPDGTPWVKFYERGHASLAPVTELGKMVTWTGRKEHVGKQDSDFWLQYTVSPDDDNHLTGTIGSRRLTMSGVPYNANLAGYYLDLTCAPETLPSVTWNDLIEEQNSKGTSPVDTSSVDPP
jgi:TonB family protein